ncbi:MAG: toll/interleukin-1 receptor domain-containing protein [Ruminococcaceae bacterium]|nr:toll/interleukin-1 receptor domain-containing protein [Oscillospiraceae bacterium]
MSQKVYQGSDPYVFVSYSHKDKERVCEIISDLMLCACNIWYDTGIHSGEDWNNEIALHLFNAECVIFMVTANSIESEYVKDELNFAKSKQKKIYPIFLENVTLSLSLELLLGRAQAISCSDSDVLDNRFKLREKIKNNLPNTVFQTLSDPFYAGENNHFYLENTSYIFPEGTYFAGEEHNSFAIRAANSTTGEEAVIYRFQARPAYDMTYSLNSVSVFDDPYFCDQDSKVIFMSLVLGFSGRYPTSWPDFDVVLTIAVSRIESKMPRVTLVDYKYLGCFTERESAFIHGVMDEIEQSFTKSK